MEGVCFCPMRDGGGVVFTIDGWGQLTNPASIVNRRTGELAELVKETLTVLNAFAKSKTSKLGTFVNSPDFFSV